MKKTEGYFQIMDLTNGNIVKAFEYKEDAIEWIEEQEEGFDRYDLLEN